MSFFDNIDRKMLMEMLCGRIADETLMRLVGKCLHVGVLEGERYLETDEGTAQGSSLSPLLGNVYLHHVLDLWYERGVRPRLKGRSALASTFTATCAPADTASAENWASCEAPHAESTSANMA